MRLRRLTAPAALPVSVADVKAHALIDSADEDALIDRLLRAAVGLVDGPDGIGRALVSQTWRLTLDGWPAVIVLPLVPVADDGIAAITYLDAGGSWQTLAADLFHVADGVITPAWGASWPAVRPVRSCIRVDFVAGLAPADIPPDLVVALCQIVSHWLENRDAVLTGTIVAEMPLSARETLDRYRTRWMAA